MTEALLLHADSESDSNLLYATGFVVPDPVLWFRKGARSYLVVNALELGRARAQARVDEVIDYGAERKRLERKSGSTPKPFDIYASILRKKGVRSLRVPPNLAVNTADSMRKLGFGVTVV